MKRTFSDRDRDLARTEGFEFLYRFFDNSLQELKLRHDGVDFDLRRIDANSFEAAIYIAGKRTSRCGIWVEQSDRGGGDILYSHSGVSRGSYNESMSIKDDGYTLGFKPMGMGFHGFDDEGMLTSQGAGEYFWAMFIQPLQER